MNLKFRIKCFVSVSALLTAMGLTYWPVLGHPPNPGRIVVLTFDDAVKSHRTLVAPFLKQMGFGATFFITQEWMDDSANFLTWQEVAEIHQMGFEIGNHSWTHADFSTPQNAAKLPIEAGLVEKELSKVGVPQPVSFAYCGNSFGPEALAELDKLGFRFARRGMQPEVVYGRIEVGPVFVPLKHHRLLIPTTGDAYPSWNLEHFRKLIDQAKEGRIVVLQFHGVPDLKHPWVNTPPERFREYMGYLKQQGVQVIALRDVEKYFSFKISPEDPLLRARFPELKR